MSEVKLVLRDATQDSSFTCHGSIAECAVAALSADPVTIDELLVAMERFTKGGLSGFSPRLPSGVDDEPWDAGLVIIDLAARLVIVDSTYFFPSRTGGIRYHNGEFATQIEVGYDLADEWMISRNADRWMELAESRRAERAGEVPLDRRAVLYGRPLIEFLATECFAIFPQREVIAQAVRVKWAEAKRARHADHSQDRSAHPMPHGSDPGRDLDGNELSEDEMAPKTRPGQERYASPYYDTLKDIHVRWLLTPREDLRGDMPREVLLADHERRVSDMEERGNQWSRTLECPRGLDTTSHAFRFGGFGTHEIIKYYDLVRELLWSCWDQLFELAQSPNPLHRPVSLGLGDFLGTEVPRLEQFRDKWLDTPDPEFEFHTPRSIIDRERSRIPEAVSGHDAMIDPDCPCCQMLADLPGPMFWHLDGSGMDNEFAFDIYHRTREEWEVEQRYFQDFGRPSPLESLEPRPPAQEEDVPRGADDPDSIWCRSYSAAGAIDAPLEVRLFCIGGHLAELLLDLRASAEAQQITDHLNRDFGNLRQVVGGTREMRSPELIEPVVSRFRESLDNVAAAHPNLERKCWDLSRQLASFLLPDRSPA